MFLLQCNRDLSSNSSINFYEIKLQRRYYGLISFYSTQYLLKFNVNAHLPPVPTIKQCATPRKIELFIM